MNDFNWDDEDMNEDSFGNSPEEGFFERVNRMMFINDIEKYSHEIIPLGPDEFVELFGNASDEDLSIMSDVLMKDSFKFDESFIIDKWGPEWLYEMLQFNIKREEYELCSIIHSMIENSQSDLLKKYFKIT